jgi:cytoskeletal protein CcmA (bactofilin family)
MGSLSNLYISSSFQSLLHFGSNNTASVTLTQIEDGFGNGLGLYLNSIGSASLDGDLTVGGDFIVSGAFDIEGKVTVNDNVRVNGNLEVSGATTLTGSLVVSNAITASNMFLSNNLSVSGTINAYEIITTIESASVIFSSGSNILGDSTSDTQTLNGSIIMSGSSSLTGSMGITGNLNVLGAGTFGGTGSFIGNLTATGNISSSTLSGVGNVTTYSASVDSRLDFLEGPFSTSVDFRLDELENWSSSLQTNFATTAELTQTASFLQNQINQKLNTSSFNDFQINNYNQYTSSVNTSITALNAFTSSALVTTGSNTFTGKQTYSSSVVGGIIDLSVVGNTASFDCSLGNFFQLGLPASAVSLNPTNIQKGQTISLKIIQNTTPTTVTYSTSIKFPFNSAYTATAVSGAIDILTFVSYDTSSLLGTAVNRLT